ncbi:metal ABC transporter ATP-binding protein [Nibricoccus sp. IMCC34717]|uniref:metal ABC transporter ATP-binding protein n=1 Tax=Nibricoccus sp. IMCC34717 TaxID=3034021 RepID=UPI00384FD954
MAAHAHNILRFHDVTIRHGSVLALDHVTAQVPCGSSTAIVGPNGAGKSTLLRAILGWHRLASGEIRIGDTHAHHQLPRLAYLPQRHAVDWDFPITVGEVVAQGRYPALGLLQRFGSRDREAVKQALDELGIRDLCERPISQLSGGQQQRVFLARAIAQGADVFLLDEPFAGLDPHATEELAHTLRAWEAQGRTVLCVLHDLGLARTTFSNALLLRNRLIACGPVREALSEANCAAAFAGPCAHDANPLARVTTARFPT